MEIAGRIVSNAAVSELTDGRQVVNFTIVVNDRYKRKAEEHFTEVATFYNFVPIGAIRVLHNT